VAYDTHELQGGVGAAVGSSWAQAQAKTVVGPVCEACVARYNPTARGLDRATCLHSLDLGSLTPCLGLRGNWCATYTDVVTRPRQDM
jgi:hypothetical protein